MKNKKSVQNRILDVVDNVVHVDFRSNVRLSKAQLNKIETAITAIELKQAHGVELTEYEEQELQRYVDRVQASLDTFNEQEGKVIYVDFATKRRAA